MKRRRLLLCTRTIQFVYGFYFGRHGQSCSSVNQPAGEEEEESFLLISLDKVKAFQLGLAASTAGPQYKGHKNQDSMPSFGRMTTSLLWL